MLLHLSIAILLPIAILASLSPIAVSDVMPKFDIAKECRFEGGATEIYNRCSHDEAEALQKLQAEWPQFVDADRNSCLAEATVGGFASYVDFLICLEMARDVRNGSTNPGNPPAKTEAQSTPPPRPEENVVDRRD